MSPHDEYGERGAWRFTAQWWPDWSGDQGVLGQQSSRHRHAHANILDKWKKGNITMSTTTEQNRP
jgi:hypothetical protein